MEIMYMEILIRFSAGMKLYGRRQKPNSFRPSLVFISVVCNDKIDAKRFSFQIHKKYSFSLQLS